MTEEKRKPTVEEMWAHVGKILAPIGHMPDKASIDDRQLQELYSSLTAADRTFKDLVQIAIFKKEINVISNEKK
jgi:hypothetical protein